MSKQRIHKLKVWPEFWTALESEEKTFEVRKNDRGFAVGDLLQLREWDPACNAYTGRELRRLVVYILHGGRFGLPENLCVMGLVLAGDR